MHTRTIPLGSKPAGYHGRVRVDAAPTLVRPLNRVLDVGCGVGANAALYRQAGATELVGIEIDHAAASEAMQTYDRVVVGDAAEALDELRDERFDSFIAWDVLEHLYDPASVVAGLRGLAADGAHLHVSVPNARNVLLARDLILRGTFGYAEEGHRDATHLRWFTRRDIVALLEECGWRVQSVTTHPFRTGRRLLNRASGGRAAEFFAVQWFVVAQL